MTAPSSFSTMCTSNCAFELIGLLLSLSIFHPDAQVYILTDTKTKQIISEISPPPKLNINYFIELDKYDGMNRQIMENNGIWSDFQMSKANIIKYALVVHADTLLLDSDIIITDVIDDIDVTKALLDKVNSELSKLGIKVYSGQKSLEQIVESENINIVLTALVGYSGLIPTINAIKHGKKIALANKERETPEYIQLDEKNKKVTFVRTPKFEEVPYPVVMEPNLVIEYYSR